MSEVKIPKPFELKDFGVEKSDREKITSDLQDEKFNYIQNDAAIHLARKQSRRFNVSIKDVDVSTITKIDVPDNFSVGKKLDKSIIKRKCGVWFIMTIQSSVSGTNTP